MHMILSALYTLNLRTPSAAIHGYSKQNNDDNDEYHSDMTLGPVAAGIMLSRPISPCTLGPVG